MDHPALALFQRGDLENRPNRFPTRSVCVVLLGQVQGLVVFANIAVDPARVATRLVLGGHTHGVAFFQLTSFGRDHFPTRGIGIVFSAQLDLAGGFADVFVHLARVCTADHIDLGAFFERNLIGG